MFSFALLYFLFVFLCFLCLSGCMFISLSRDDGKIPGCSKHSKGSPTKGPTGPDFRGFSTMLRWEISELDPGREGSQKWTKKYTSPKKTLYKWGGIPHTNYRGDGNFNLFFNKKTSETVFICLPCNMAIAGKSHFFMGDTSSDGWNFPFVM